MSAAIELRPIAAAEIYDDGGPVEIPPHDLDAEAAVISCAFIDASCVGRIEFLSPEHFYSEAHRRIWEAILAVNAEPAEPGETSCLVRVGSRLKASGRIAQAGGMAYLTTVLNAAPSVSNVVKYAVIIFERWRTRQVIARCQRIAAIGYAGVAEVQDFCEKSTKAIAAIADRNPLRPVESNDVALARIVARVNPDESKSVARSSWGYPTGLNRLDLAICGLMPQHKTTIAALTGVGKTALALQIAVKLAKDGVGVLFFSTEMRREELLQRAVSAESNVPNERIKRRQLARGEFTAIVDAAHRIKKLPIRIDERPRITVEEIKAATIAHAERARLLDRVPLGLVIVDYVQRLEVRPELDGLKDHEKIRHSTKSFKQMLQELNLAGIELAQAKSPEKGKKWPTKDDIADSKAPSKEADELIFITDDEDRGAYRDVTLHVVKQRDGKPYEEIPLEFYGNVFRFEDPSDQMRSVSRDYVDREQET